jgi:nitrate reductase molybdenum cofactor assembly chaperone NarJ/NarW
MANTYTALGLLLRYPDEALREAYPAAGELIDAEPRFPSALKQRLKRLAEDLASADLLDLQARYVRLFDQTRSLSLNLYEHVHGESRDRGQAMVELLKLYSAHGLELSAQELPDHLPVFVEFLSVLPHAQAATLLGEAAHVLEALHVRLKKRRSPYACVFEALAALAAARADGEALAALMQEPEDDPDDLEALDRAWAEEPVTFGPGDASCPKATEMLARMGEKTR